MASTLDPLIAHLIAIELRLITCRERLAAHTDSEALHDLRTTVRRLRSLLRPLRGLPGIDRLEDGARALGQLTTPMRDREVLAAHLLEQGYPELAYPRQQAAAAAFTQVARCSQLSQLLNLLSAIVPLLRTAQRNGVIEHLGRMVDKRLAKQHRQLRKALADPAHDRHRLRLLIKRVRYAAEAYPEREPLPKGMAKALKKAQEALGDWHDHVQWLRRAEEEPELAPLAAQWQAAQDEAEGRSDKALSQLARYMKK
ncbi:MULTISPECIES: CHAD domain-containing protein [unclassified Pseudomonas]|uniref:CHAD domain-containing protein n=1 Tax=unclassified Pseudomonas TaxID=196821 RepID=UPI000BCA512F|nr:MULTISPECIES: CHAD domain-containing protein [unclassified Pseudomonas]PVZ20149.1 CHAD domain-containing protein [Pseudomonas sp. URIL14HWK12:I12]PVZ27215.1 CHAD domain-containing protein [Pseudomonas sp. URIL14HWK12:I10]PVZ38104.1 CHAD domain-containing protein [Pseudomonas sp. URIL14HWK12:I11]SNZ04548.1 CHAD domain-containing protein [Pseudomonas sp. URIL14HWK12:I9]